MELETREYTAQTGRIIKAAQSGRLRTKRTKGCLSRKTGLAMAFRLMMSAQKKWRKLDGRNRLPDVISGVEFRDGVRHLQAAA